VSCWRQTRPTPGEDITPREVRGTLHADWLDGFERFQCFVDGVLVNSHTVKMDPDAGEGRAG
jgi:hypothetical protein